MAVPALALLAKGFLTAAWKNPAVKKMAVNAGMQLAQTGVTAVTQLAQTGADAGVAKVKSALARKPSSNT